MWKRKKAMQNNTRFRHYWKLDQFSKFWHPKVIILEFQNFKRVIKKSIDTSKNNLFIINPKKVLPIIGDGVGGRWGKRGTLFLFFFSSEGVTSIGQSPIFLKDCAVPQNRSLEMLPQRKDPGSIGCTLHHLIGWT